MSQPRVLLSFPLRIGTPGIGTTAYQQACGLARQGADISVATGSVERPMPGVRVALETMRLAGRRLPYRAVGNERAAAWHDARVARHVARSEPAYDVVHVWPGGCLRTLAAARRRGIPTFMERPNAHTAAAFEIVARECERIGMRLAPSSPHAFDADKLRQEEAEFAAADALLCPSDFVASTHADRGEPAHRLLRHRYGHDPAQFNAPATERAASDRVQFAFVGRLEPRKGAHLLLEAWRRAEIADRARLVLCGATEPGYDEVLAPLLQSPGVDRRGHVSDPAALMRESDALVLPSLEEGSALVTYEARACGAVLVISDRAGAVAEDRRDALIHPAGDVDALARDLRELTHDPALRSRLRSASLAGVDALTWDAAAVALLEAYAEGAERRRAASRPDVRASV